MILKYHKTYNKFGFIKVSKNFQKFIFFFHDNIEWNALIYGDSNYILPLFVIQTLNIQNIIYSMIIQIIYLEL